MTQLIVVCLLQTVPVGTTFESKQWPLHSTVLPWVKLDDVDPFVDAVKTMASSQAPFEIEVGPEEVFGALKVNVVVPNPVLTKLHNQTLQLADGTSKLVDSTYVGDRYRAHISHYDGHFKKHGDRVEINSITIVESLSLTKRRVKAVYEL